MAYSTDHRTKGYPEGDCSSELHQAPLAIAHDVRSYLRLAGERASRLLSKLPDGLLRAELSCIAQGIRSGLMVLDDFASLPHPEDPPASADIALRRTFRLLRPWLLRNAISVEGLDNAGRMALRQTDLERLLHNLILNAREEVGHKGRIALSFRNGTWIPGGRTRADIEIACVQITIGDDGHGIPRAEVERAELISSSRSSDLPMSGLAIAYAIVRSAGGRIRFESQRGSGTRVHCYLPRASDPRNATTTG